MIGTIDGFDSILYYTILYYTILFYTISYHITISPVGLHTVESLVLIKCHEKTQATTKGLDLNAHYAFL